VRYGGKAKVTAIALLPSLLRTSATAAGESHGDVLGDLTPNEFVAQCQGMRVAVARASRRSCATAASLR
jgi:hypothetical protein